MTGTDTVTGLRARRRAGWRLPALACGHRDPWDCRAARHDAPDSFGLDTRELWAEIRRCQRFGWQAWEIRRRFTNPRTLTPSGEVEP